MGCAVNADGECRLRSCVLIVLELSLRRRLPHSYYSRPATNTLGPPASTAVAVGCGGSLRVLPEGQTVISPRSGGDVSQQLPIEAVRWSLRSRNRGPQPECTGHDSQVAIRRWSRDDLHRNGLPSFSAAANSLSRLAKNAG